MKKILRTVFSRNGLCILLIICEIGGIIPFFKALADNSVVLWVIAYAVGYLTFLYILNQDMTPEHKIPWIAIVLIIPPFGALFYGMFHGRRLSRKDAKHLEVLREQTGKTLENQNTGQLTRLQEMDLDTYGKAMALLKDDEEAEVFQNTRSQYFALGDEMYPAMLEDLKKAENFIFLEYFIVEEGVMWDAMLKILKEKVKAGVEVRMLYDDLGCFATLPSDYDQTLRNEGIDCHPFSKFTPIASVVHNNRDHRKILVVDGVVGYTGGINLADEYINKKQVYGHWKDGGICLEGDAVRGLTKLFLTNWDINNKTISVYQKYLSPRKTIQDAKGYYIPFGSGPEPMYNTPVGKNVFLNLINQSRKSVYIMTPYLIIDYELTDALRNAAKRGVEVCIITPHIPDKKLIFLMTKSNYPGLIKAGVKIFEYEAGFIHAKNIVVDDKYAVAGTINFDYRSLVHHYEDGVFLCDTETIPQITTDCLNTMKQSIEITEEEAVLTVPQLLLKNLVNLISPLL